MDKIADKGKMRLLFVFLIVFVSCGKNPSGPSSGSLVNNNVTDGALGFQIVKCEDSPSCSGSCKNSQVGCYVACSGSQYAGHITLQNKCRDNCKSEYNFCIIDSCQNYCTPLSETYDILNSCMTSCREI